MSYYATHQDKLKAHKYKKRTFDPHTGEYIEKSIKLFPRSHTGSPRWYQEKKRQSFSVARTRGVPTLFLTPTVICFLTIFKIFYSNPILETMYHLTFFKFVNQLRFEILYVYFTKYLCAQLTNIITKSSLPFLFTAAQIFRTILNSKPQNYFYTFFLQSPAFITIKTNVKISIFLPNPSCLPIFILFTTFYPVHFFMHYPFTYFYFFSSIRGIRI